MDNFEPKSLKELQDKLKEVGSKIDILIKQLKELKNGNN